ncbi:MAG: NAD(P)-dependent alcohol dehydrogenase [Myxococcales bacterium]|nr:NAD(P)-dependent alcohol dehydrogenase [Myxococcales bacterium]
MRAVANRVYGAPEVLTATEVERPTIGARQILVQVHASAVTHGDRRLRAADFPGISGVFGRLVTGILRPRHPIGGSSFAGRVVEVGAEVTRFAVGDEVFGGAMHGAYAEYLAISDEAVGKMPENTTYGEAAALPYGAVTALVFLRDMAKVQPGERVLVVGASGGVGRMAVQIAKHLGAHVTGVGSRDQDLVRALGADHFIDYNQEDFTQRDERWDVIFDTTEGNHFQAFRPSLTTVGRYLSLYVTLRVLLEMAVTALRGGPRAMAGVAMGNGKLLDDVRTLVERGAVRAVIAKRYPLEQIADAHSFFEASRPRGSVVIDVVDIDAAPRRTTTRDRRDGRFSLTNEHAPHGPRQPVLHH